MDGRPGAIRPTPRNKLSPAQRQQLLDTVHQPAFASQPPGQIVPALADERGVYLASESTFYRVLRAAGQQPTAAGRNPCPPLSTGDPCSRGSQPGLGVGHLVAAELRARAVLLSLPGPRPLQPQDRCC